MTFFLWISLFLAISLFLLSSFLSAAETALTAFSRPRIYRLAKKGNMRAKSIEQLTHKMNHVIGSILIGNNATNMLATALATAIFTKLFDEVGVAIASGIMTLLLIIFLEVMPKMYTITHAESLILKIAPAIKFCLKILSPLMSIVSIISERALALFGSPTPQPEGWSSTLEELRSAIDLHGKEKLQKESVMLHSILDLSSVLVKEIMIHRSDVEMIDADQSIEKVYQQVLKSPYSRLPVWKGSPENIVGVIHIKTFLKEFVKASHSQKKLDIKKACVSPWFIPETTPLLYQMQAFRQKRHHLALVVDEYGAFCGIVTLEDILEEIVGEIDDEHDLKNSDIRRTKEHAYLVDGSVTVRDFNRQFGLEVPDEEASTLAGLVINESRAIPKVGQSFKFYGIEFKVLRREDNQLTLLRVKIPEMEDV